MPIPSFVYYSIVIVFIVTILAYFNQKKLKVMDNQIDILAFGAHPDDVELSCAGTILKHVSLGNKIGIVTLQEESWVLEEVLKSEIKSRLKQLKY